MTAATVETAWKDGRFTGAGGPGRVLFGRMYEDVAVEREVFAGRGRVFTIASAGSMARVLSEEHAVVACDINPVQLAYAERRLAGGPLVMGDAERVMAAARRWMPLIGWRRERVREFLELADLEEQRVRWRTELDTWRFRWGMDVLVARPVLRAVYAREFLQFLPAQFGAILRGRWERALTSFPNRTNPYARALLLGEGEEPGRPRREAVEFVAGDAASYLESCPARSFAGFTLSNILDGAATSYRRRLFAAVRRAAEPGAMVVLRSFGEPRGDEGSNWAARDRSLLWGVVDVRAAEGLE